MTPQTLQSLIDAVLVKIPTVSVEVDVPANMEAGQWFVDFRYGDRWVPVLYTDKFGFAWDKPEDLAFATPFDYPMQQSESVSDTAESVVEFLEPKILGWDK